MELFPSRGRLEAALADPLCLHVGFEAGEVIYAPLRFDRCLGLVLEGRVRVEKTGLSMGVLGPGDWFGAAAIFDETRGGAYAATLTAAAKCRAALLPEELVRRLVREEPGFAEGYITYLASRIRFLSGRIDALSAGDAAARLLRFLMAQADEDGRVSLSAAELARRVGVARATLYRAFDELERRGVIRRAGKTIFVVSLRGGTT